MAGISLLFTSLFLLVSVFFPQYTGRAGMHIASVLVVSFGAAAYGVPVLFAYLGYRLVLPEERAKDIPAGKMISFSLCFLSFLFLLTAMDPDALSRNGVALGGGISQTALYFLFPLVGRAGSILFLLAVFLVSYFVCLDVRASFIVNKVPGFLDTSRLFLKRARFRLEGRWVQLSAFLKKLSQIEVKIPKLQRQAAVQSAVALQPVVAAMPPVPVAPGIQIPVPLKEGNRVVTANEKPGSTQTQEDVLDSVEAQTVEDYQLPSLSIFREASQSGGNGHHLEVGKKIVETLREFGVEARLSDISPGPVVTRYELIPAPGVKVKGIVNLSNDLALRLAAAPIRIEAPIPGKSAVGIEVPNQQRELVPISDLLKAIGGLEDIARRLYVGLGKDLSGEHRIADLTRMPHLLIAGATGAGKSVCLNTLVSSLLFYHTPAEVRFLLIDPKRVELSIFKGVPHLAGPVITDVRQASEALKRAIQIMDSRYEDFAAAGVRNIESYNEKFPEDKKYYFVIIVDELADLMLQVGPEVEKSICRLAQLGRATGIHLVIATQRPSVNVITGLIKANIPSRIAFAVVSQMDSRIILDTVGAENLLGRGDMLYLPMEAPKPTRMQGANISDVDLKQLVETWKSQGKPGFLEEFQDLPKAEFKEPELEEADGTDEFFDEAVRIVLENKQASVSILQRKLKVGYARAGRLIDLMERKGLVGPFEGSKAREILVGWEYFNNRGPGVQFEKKSGFRS